MFLSAVSLQNYVIQTSDIIRNGFNFYTQKILKIFTSCCEKITDFILVEVAVISR